VGSTVLVTGATGKTGRRLVPMLSARGVAVRAASRNPGPAAPGVEPVRFDWLDEGTYRAALTGIDALYLAVSDNGIARVGAFLTFAAEAGVRRVVLLSAFGTDQADPGLPLRGQELAVEGSGMASTILRPGAFMQNFSESHPFGLAARIRERSEIVLPGGPHPASYVSADDIAAVAAVALTEDGHEGRGYTLTGPESLTLTEVAERISTAAGRTVRYVESGPEPIRDALLEAGVAAEFAGYAAQLYAESAGAGLMAAVTGDVADVTGRPPMTFADYATGAAGAWRA
jgi:uncharacterized protein YbjT (DUF2867 family)